MSSWRVENNLVIYIILENKKIGFIITNSFRDVPLGISTFRSSNRNRLLLLLFELLI